ncbi:MAG: hypothetical protein KTR31_11355 [Myxococcales bacterium]|nr:hypothetical protein [Myxococcales bacterium]
MPELPEAEICRRQLRAWARERPLATVRVLDPAVVRHKLSSRPSDAWPEGVRRVEGWVGRPAGDTARHGKRIAWSFGGDAVLLHLGMTGRWIRRPEAEAPPSVARIGLGFGDEVLWMLDTRRFACLVPLPADELSLALRGKQGPDALEEPLDGPGLAAAMRSKRPVKVLLMEQGRLAGLGNIHAAEACFRAKVSPMRAADSLSDEEWASLATAIVAQLRDTLAGVDATEEMSYVSEGGANPFAVYKRTGKPCPSCGTAIASREQGGRTTYWCPSCQSG